MEQDYLTKEILLLRQQVKMLIHTAAVLGTIALGTSTVAVAAIVSYIIYVKH